MKTALRPGWHSCADCEECDGTAGRHCSWSAFCGGVGHQDAACQHERPRPVWDASGEMVVAKRVQLRLVTV